MTRAGLLDVWLSCVFIVMSSGLFCSLVGSSLSASFYLTVLGPLSKATWNLMESIEANNALAQVKPSVLRLSDIVASR